MVNINYRRIGCVVYRFRLDVIMHNIWIFDEDLIQIKDTISINMFVYQPTTVLPLNLLIPTLWSYNFPIIWCLSSKNGIQNFELCQMNNSSSNLLLEIIKIVSIFLHLKQWSSTSNILHFNLCIRHRTLLQNAYLTHCTW